MNEVSATFKSKELFVIPACFIHTLFKVHAIRDGHQELVKRVARKNGGLCPTAKLQQELHLAAMADGGIRTAEEFSEQNESLFGGRGRRRDREARGRVHVTEEGEANATEDSPSTGDRGKGKGKGGRPRDKGGDKGNRPPPSQATPILQNVCFNYQSRKCKLEDCPREHVRIDIPRDLCKDHLLWRSCEGPPKCTRTHSTWPEVVKLINEGAPSSSAGTTPQKGSEPPRDRSRSRKPREKKEKDPAKKTEGDKDATCSRCGKKGHEKAACYSTFDSEGKTIESEKPAPIPEAVQKRRASFKKKGEANALDASPDNGGFFLKITKEKGGTAHPVEGRPDVPHAEPPLPLESTNLWA